jgi:hypothetical protein
MHARARFITNGPPDTACLLHHLTNKGAFFCRRKQHRPRGWKNKEQMMWIGVFGGMKRAENVHGLFYFLR